MKRSIWGFLSTVAMTTLLIACGGGGGTTVTPPTTVSGVAAAGAPIIGFAYLKDSANHELGPNTIDSSGNFSFDLTKFPAGSSAPYYLQAQGAAGGQSFVLHSVVGSAGTANINPLTNLVLAQATGGKDPAAVFTDTSAVSVTSQNISDAITAMRTSLAPLLNAAGVANPTTMNPITDSYVANPATNKLDALFDVVTITVAPVSGSTSTVTVMDKSGNAILPTTSVTTTPATMASTVTTNIANSNVSQTMTDSSAITTFLQGFATTVNNKGANLATSDLAAYYYGTDATFGWDGGYTRTQTLQNMVANIAGKALLQVHGQITSMANIAIVKDVTQNQAYLNAGSAPLYNKVYRISADFKFLDGSIGTPNTNMTVVQATAGGAWQFIGNGQMADIDISPYANQAIQADSSVAYRTGMYIWLEDVGNLGINSASIEGPGLPSGGVTFSKTASGSSSNTRLSLDSAFQGYQVSDAQGQYEMNDTQIAQMVTGIPASTAQQYTLKFYSGATAPADRVTGLMQTLHPIIRATPILNTSVAAAALFPTATISGLTHQMSSFITMMNGMSSIPFTYTLPTAYSPAWMSAWVDVWDNSSNGQNNQHTSMQLALNATSDTMTVVKPGFTPTNGFLTVESQDSARRYFKSIWVLQ